MSVVRSSCGGLAIRYALPVLWMTSCLYTKARNRRRNSDSVGSSVDLLRWRVLKLTHQGAALNGRRNLLSTIARLFCAARSTYMFDIPLAKTSSSHICSTLFLDGIWTMTYLNDVLMLARQCRETVAPGATLPGYCSHTV